MNTWKAIPIFLIGLFIVCIGVAAYLSKYHKDPIATLHFSSSGCFHYRTYNLSIVQGNNSTIAQLDTAGKVLVKKTITLSQLDTFNDFVSELKQHRSGGNCTTYETYKLHHKGDVINLTDASCKWHGFQKITMSLFEREF